MSFRSNKTAQPDKNISFLTLDDIDVAGKTVLVRLDLNVPMVAGKVTDKTRIQRQLPTLKELLQKKAKPVIMAHLGRPKGVDLSLSLSPLVDELNAALGANLVAFSSSTVGESAKKAVRALQPGCAVLLENLRFHAEEEKNDKDFAKELAGLGEIYVNDAFSCAHRAHASTEGVTHFLPSYAGRLMEEELATLDSLFTGSQKPLVAIVGGSKISTKLTLLENLACRVDHLIVGGAMANTFLLAQGHEVGTSLVEKDLVKTAKKILKSAESNGCDIVLPKDVVVAEAFKAQSACKIVPVTKVPKQGMILDVGPLSVAHLSALLATCRTLVWNGPVGAFETSPFDVGTVSIARLVAMLTQAGGLKSVAGGGDTVAALTHAGLAGGFSYLSTAGGAFLEWMEGRELPGVVALKKAA
jgi:phosphoglycerate kinase